MKLGRVLLAATLLLCMASLANAQDKKATGGGAAQLNRGKYLVEQVGMCADCHSPRNEKGEYLKDKWLQGSPLFFKPNFPVPGWVEVAPGIAGFPGWNDKDAVAFLTTGKGLNGKVAGPPMPQFRFSHADAAAVAAYLKSIKPEISKAPAGSKKQKKTAGSSGF